MVYNSVIRFSIYTVLFNCYYFAFFLQPDKTKKELRQKNIAHKKWMQQ